MYTGSFTSNTLTFQYDCYSNDYLQNSFEIDRFTLNRKSIQKLTSF